MTRLASEIWVAAYFRRLDREAILAALVRRGDAKAGVILIKLNLLDGQAELYEARYDLTRDRREWVLRVRDNEARIDVLLSREGAQDPDLWVIEVDDRLGRHFLDEPGLAP